MQCVHVMIDAKKRFSYRRKMYKLSVFENKRGRKENDDDDDEGKSFIRFLFSYEQCRWYFYN